MALSREFDRVQPHMELWVAVRTAFIDDRVRALTGEGGASQVVILGAGLDARAARLAAPGLRFYEVDRPASQADRHRRLSALVGYPPDAATAVACDFEHQDFVDQLLAAGFDGARPALLIWEGVSYYLSEPVVRSTLSRVARRCDPRSTLVFDLVGARMARGAVRHGNDRETRDVVAGLGEPILWGTDDVLPVLYEEGFHRVRVTTFDEAALLLTGTYERERRWRFQYITEASVAPTGLNAP